MDQHLAGGHDLYIKSGCLNNKGSYTNKSSYGISSSGEKNFKVLDYEVFQI